MKRRAVVVDLDGTLLSTNTFKKYVLFVAKESLVALHIDVTLSVMFFVALRLMRVVSHSTMKYYLLKKSARFMRADRLNQLADMLLLKVNPNVAALCRSYRKQGYYMLLATAAPENYAVIVSSRMGFDGCCATMMPQAESEWGENAREQKLESVLRHLDSVNASVAIVITDHHDDIPLMKVSQEKNILVNPAYKTVVKINNSDIGLEKLN